MIPFEKVEGHSVSPPLFEANFLCTFHERLLTELILRGTIEMTRRVGSICFSPPEIDLGDGTAARQGMWGLWHVKR